jgi:hypothetical protein
VPGVGKGLLEGDSLYEEGGTNLSSRDLLNSDKVEVGEVGLKAADGLDDHGGEEILVGGNELGVEGGTGAFEEHLLSLLALEGDRELLYGFYGELSGLAHVANEDLGVHPGLDEFLNLLKHLSSEEHHGGGSVSDLGVLTHTDVDEGLGGGVSDL